MLRSILAIAAASAVLAPAALGGDPVIAAAGDVACDPGFTYFNGGAGTTSWCRQRYTSDVLVGLRDAGQLQGVLTLGDTQYNDNTYSKFMQSFDPSWGRVKPLIHPTLGNHEFINYPATGYCQYFAAAAHCLNGSGNRAGWYSFEIGAWHLIALNSNCFQAGGCGLGSAQEQWLKADLAAHPNQCVLAYWHHPRFSSGNHGSDATYQPFWQDLYNAGADVVLSGHDHVYERFAPQNPQGNLDTTRGLRQFVVGTGGKSISGFATIRPNSQIRSNAAYGVLKLVLHASSYDWRFVAENGKTFTDSGTQPGH